MLQLWTELTEAVTRAAEQRQAVKIYYHMSYTHTHTHTVACTVHTHLSVILVQPFRLSSSMFLQFCEKVLQGKNTIQLFIGKLTRVLQTLVPNTFI